MRTESEKLKHPAPFILCLRMSSIGDVLMTTRALFTVHSAGFTPVLVTHESMKDVAESMPFLNHVILFGSDHHFELLVRMAAQHDSKVNFNFEKMDLSLLAKNCLGMVDLQNTSRSKKAWSKLKASFPHVQEKIIVEKKSLSRIALLLKASFAGQRQRPTNDHPPGVLERQQKAVRTLITRLQDQAFQGLSGQSFVEKNIFPFSEQITAGKLFNPEREISFPERRARQSFDCVLFAGASLPLKSWPLENCREFAEEICRAGFNLAVIGGPEEAAFAKEIVKNQPRAQSFAGILTLRETFLLISNARFLVTTDSFPAHASDIMASQQLSEVNKKRKSLVLFGATSPKFGFVPLSDDLTLVYKNLSCSPCTRHGRGKCRFGNQLCMSGISGKKIAQQVILALDKNKA